jgi:Sec-independent protein translocase protein TatA
MILFRNVGSVLKTFDKAIKDLDAMMERDTKKTERGEAYKEKVAVKADRKIEKAKAKRRAKRERASEYIAALKAELTRASNAVEKLSEISGY